MITRSEAITIYLDIYPDRLVDEVFETSDLWIISGKDKNTGEELDVSPTSIRKDNGDVAEFFPPSHLGYTKTDIPTEAIKKNRGE